MSKIRSIVYGTSLFVALAFAVIGGTGINSTMAAASGDAATSGPTETGCIIAILKSEKAQKMNAIAAPSDDDPGCVISMRKAGGDPEVAAVLTVRKAGGDQHEY
jgi:hypothetical protein